MLCSHCVQCSLVLQTIGEVGTVSAVMDSGDVRVRYGGNHTWTINSDGLVKVCVGGSTGHSYYTAGTV